LIAVKRSAACSGIAFPGTKNLRSVLAFQHIAKV